MPSIKDQNTVNALAREYISNDRCKEKAMVSVGYTSAYARSYCGKMWANKALQEAIKALERELADKNEWNIKIALIKLKSIIEQAIKLKQPSAAVSGVVAANRMFGMDKDNDAGKQDQAQQLSKEDKDLLRAMSKALADKELAQGPTLAQDGQGQAEAG